MVKGTQLFEAACCGRIDDLKALVAEGEPLDFRYPIPGGEVSLIMGAMNNQEWATVDWLLKEGATLTDAEQRSINNEFQRSVFIARMQTCYRGRESS